MVLVKEGRLIKDRSFANRVSILLSRNERQKIASLTTEDEEHFKRHLFRYLLYRIGELNMGCCCCMCCSTSFKKKGVNHAMKFTRRLYYMQLLLMGLQVLVSSSAAVVDNFAYNSQNLSKEELLKHLAYVGIPMCCATCLLALGTVYLLTVNGRLMNQVSDKRDPFSNTTLLVLLLVF